MFRDSQLFLAAQLLVMGLNLDSSSQRATPYGRIDRRCASAIEAVKIHAVC
jgi:hypothetical protein